MRLIRLVLANWRGIESREIRFDPGVTIIEGPNEIGKSTLVEAIQLLFGFKDSSKAAPVLAIQPVGQDVGSRVELELETGEYRFVYSKQFNRSTATTLDVSRPKAMQLTGGEAHDKAQEILDATVDLGLWKALLIDQGTEVAQANLKDSRGLSKALDQAAGSSGLGDEDSSLLTAADTERLKYFTPKGQPRNREAQARFEKAAARRDEATAALEAIEADVRQHEHYSVEAARLATALPDLQEGVDRHDRDWQRVVGLQEKVASARKTEEAAQQLLNTITEEAERRRELGEEIEQGRQRLKETEEAAIPFTQRVETLKQQCASAQQEFDTAKSSRKTTRAAWQLAKADLQHHENLTSRVDLQARYDRLQQLESEMQAVLDQLAANSMSDEALETLRDSEVELRGLSGERQSVATVVRIEAESILDFAIDDSASSLAAGDSHVLELASETQLAFPGVARLTIKPPQSAEQLDEKLDEAKSHHAVLLGEHGVAGYAEAVARNTQRKEAEWELDRLKARESELLSDASPAELRAQLDALKLTCDRYLSGRPESPELPSSLQAAKAEVDRLESALEDCEAEVLAREEALRELIEELGIASSDLQDAEQTRIRVDAELKGRAETLAKLQARESDAELQVRNSQQHDIVKELDAGLKQLEEELASESPEATELKLANARSALARAQRELADVKTDLAVVADRLQTAQAGGRHEMLEQAEREYAEAESASSRQTRNADAIQLLWETLNRHRDVARKSYIKPLKDRIERLAEVVFGSGCEIEIDDDWTLAARILHGRRIPFDSLSVGAREQLGILVRLAVAQIVSDEGGVPLIIDDALGFSDPTRLETMGAAISRAGESGQIVILTCSPGRFTHVGNARLERF